jgi:hypothetical protein
MSASAPAAYCRAFTVTKHTTLPAAELGGGQTMLERAIVPLPDR